MTVFCWIPVLWCSSYVEARGETHLNKGETQPAWATSWNQAQMHTHVKAQTDTKTVWLRQTTCWRKVGCEGPLEKKKRRSWYFCLFFPPPWPQQTYIFSFISLFLFSGSGENHSAAYFWGGCGALAGPRRLLSTVNRVFCEQSAQTH